MVDLVSLHELEVSHFWRRDRAYVLEPVKIVADAVEKPLTATEERRHEADVHLVYEPGHEILLRGTRASGKRYVLAAYELKEADRV